MQSLFICIKNITNKKSINQTSAYAMRAAITYTYTQAQRKTCIMHIPGMLNTGCCKKKTKQKMCLTQNEFQKASLNCPAILLWYR